jgi:prepilin-type N-terminal cleavage/methylation domain-containing protein
MSQRKPLRNERGYTLVELMVVVAILGILSSWVSVGFGPILAKSRDRKRVSDLSTFHHAVQQFAMDHNNVYPITDCAGNAFRWGSTDAAPFMWMGICTVPGGPIVYPNLNAALSPYLTDITKLTDPRKPGNGLSWGYKYQSVNGRDFRIMIYGTPENMFNFPREYWTYEPSDCSGYCCVGEPNSSGQCSTNVVSIQSSGYTLAL